MKFLISVLALMLLEKYARATSVNIEPYKQHILDVHNEDRRNQKASDMQELVWDDELSKKAANWIRSCRFEHESKGWGENLAFNTDKNVTKDVDTAMKNWYDEIKLYNYNRKSCAPRSCHYTQMIWAKTRKIGCALEKCDSLYAFRRGIKDAYYLGCWYHPKGNYISEFPYTRGAPCSKCLKNQKCRNGLCIGKHNAFYDLSLRPGIELPLNPVCTIQALKGSRQYY